MELSFGIVGLEVGHPFIFFEPVYTGCLNRPEIVVECAALANMQKALRKAF